jgi:hypothetical protein
MNEVFVITPQDVTLGMIRDVLQRKWTLDEEMGLPSVELDVSKRAYVAEVDAKTIEDPLFFQPGEHDELRRRLDKYRVFSVRYTSPVLGRAMARAIATSALAERPMMIDYHDQFVTPKEFLARTAED